MLKLFVTFVGLILLRVYHTSASKTLSCELAASVFEDYLCKQDTPYQITPFSITYLVMRDDQLFQMKVKHLSNSEMDLYKEQVQKNSLEMKDIPSKASLFSQKNVKKEIVSPRMEGKLKNIQRDKEEITSVPQKIKIDIDGNIDSKKIDELKFIKNHHDQEKVTKSESDYLKEKINDEESENKTIEKLELYNPYTIMQIPKKVIIELNESKLMMKLKNKRHFQNIYNEEIFAGFKISILNYYPNGTLREFLEKDLLKPIEEQFFKSDLSKMEFFSNLVQAVIDLHSMQYIHSNLNPDTIYIDENMDPVIGAFDFVHEKDFMSQMDPLFFITQGETNSITDISKLNFQEFFKTNNESKDQVKGSLITSLNSNFNLQDFNKIETQMTFKRSLEYTAPELLLAGSNKSVYFDTKIDTYSLGCVYFYMLYRKAPFKGDNIDEILEALKIRSVVLKSGITMNSVSLFYNTLNLNSNNRAPAYYLGLRLKRLLALNFEHKLSSDLEIATDFEYSTRYGRNFFDKYSEMIFVLLMAFIIIPMTVFLSSYKFKQERIRETNNGNNNTNDAALNVTTELARQEAAMNQLPN